MRHVFALLCLGVLAAAQNAAPDLTQYVNPFIGTGEGAPGFDMGSAAGNTPPGAAYPFGMALWSPDTTSDSGGYRYQHDTIRGFSLTHFSGRGIACWQDLPFQPVPGGVTDADSAWDRHASTFAHAAERASPGHYGVDMDNGVTVDLTVTRRTGFARFRFPAGDQGTVWINASGSANGNWDKTWLQFAGDRVVFGAVTSGNCGGWFNYTLYFAAVFDRSSIAHGADTQGASQGTYLTFDTSADPVVQAKVGLSFVSYTNAYDNLTTESPGWDFDAAREQARSAWNQRLNAIRVDATEDTGDLRTIFYTALYHASIHPSTFSDANGEYLGFDGSVHHTNRTQYHNVPTWDFYRSLVPLLAITAPDVASDLAQSLVNDAQQDPGGGMPRWVHAAADSCGMYGDGGSKVVAVAHSFGARDFDVSGALAAMVRDANQPAATSSGCPVREGLDEYLKLGYVSSRIWGSASRTLAYATSDFAISQMAAATGDAATARVFLKRAQNWRNLMRNQYIVPRDASGAFATGFAPDGCVTDGFVEGSGGQYVFTVRFNAQGLFQAFGGNTAAVSRLDRHFQQLNAGPCSEFAFMGNEPSLTTPWLYDFAGAPWKTQEVVRRILLQLYANAPGGMPGNDDGGVLSAWVVFAAIGLYPEIPGVGGFVVGSPIFPRVTVSLRDGAQVVIDAPGAGPGAPYLQRLQINGSDYSSPWIPWSAVSGGAALTFTLGPAPNRSWGSQGAAAPPSYEPPDGE